MQKVSSLIRALPLAQVAKSIKSPEVLATTAMAGSIFAMTKAVSYAVQKTNLKGAEWVRPFNWAATLGVAGALLASKTNIKAFRMGVVVLGAAGTIMSILNTRKAFRSTGDLTFFTALREGILGTKNSNNRVIIAELSKEDQHALDQELYEEVDLAPNETDLLATIKSKAQELVAPEQKIEEPIDQDKQLAVRDPIHTLNVGIVLQNFQVAQQYQAEIDAFNRMATPLEQHRVIGRLLMEVKMKQEGATLEQRLPIVMALLGQLHPERFEAVINQLPAWMMTLITNGAYQAQAEGQALRNNIQAVAAKVCRCDYSILNKKVDVKDFDKLQEATANVAVGVSGIGLGDTAGEGLWQVFNFLVQDRTTKETRQAVVLTFLQHANDAQGRFGDLARLFWLHGKWELWVAIVGTLQPKIDAGAELKLNAWANSIAVEDIALMVGAGQYKRIFFDGYVFHPIPYIAEESQQQYVEALQMQCSDCFQGVKEVKLDKMHDTRQVALLMKVLIGTLAAKRGVSPSGSQPLMLENGQGATNQFAFESVWFGPDIAVDDLVMRALLSKGNKDYQNISSLVVANASSITVQTIKFLSTAGRTAYFPRLRNLMLGNLDWSFIQAIGNCSTVEALSVNGSLSFTDAVLNGDQFQKTFPNLQQLTSAETLVTPRGLWAYLQSHPNISNKVDLFNQYPAGWKPNELGGIISFWPAEAIHQLWTVLEVQGGGQQLVVASDVNSRTEQVALNAAQQFAAGQRKQLQVKLDMMKYMTMGYKLSDLDESGKPADYVVGIALDQEAVSDLINDRGQLHALEGPKAIHYLYDQIMSGQAAHMADWIIQSLMEAEDEKPFKNFTSLVRLFRFTGHWSSLIAAMQKAQEPAPGLLRPFHIGEWAQGIHLNDMMQLAQAGKFNQIIFDQNYTDLPVYFNRDADRFEAGGRLAQLKSLVFRQPNDEGIGAFLEQFGSESNLEHVSVTGNISSSTLSVLRTHLKIKSLEILSILAKTRLEAGAFVNLRPLQTLTDLTLGFEDINSTNLKIYEPLKLLRTIETLTIVPDEYNPPKGQPRMAVNGSLTLGRDLGNWFAAYCPPNVHTVILHETVMSYTDSFNKEFLPKIPPHVKKVVLYKMKNSQLKFLANEWMNYSNWEIQDHTANPVVLTRKQAADKG